MNAQLVLDPFIRVVVRLRQDQSAERVVNLRYVSQFWPSSGGLCEIEIVGTGEPERVTLLSPSYEDFCALLGFGAEVTS